MSDAAIPLTDPAERKTSTRKLLTWFILIAIVMFFAGLTSAYVVSMSGTYWVDLRIPAPFLWSTAFIVVSSVFAQLALMAVDGPGRSRIPVLLAITLALGIAFAASQFAGWRQLVHQGNVVVGKVLDNKGTYGTDWTILRNNVALVEEQGRFYAPDDTQRLRPLNAELEEQFNTSSSYFYVLTAAHLAHLFFGLLALAIMVGMAALGRYTAADHSGLWAGVIYWHFLGALWVYLLLFLTLVH